MSETYRMRPEPAQLFALTRAVRPLHGEERPVHSQSFISREMLEYSLGGCRGGQAFSGHIRRHFLGLPHELWQLSLRDTFRSGGTFQHTKYDFCWDAQAVYRAARAVLLGGAALHPTLADIEESFHQSSELANGYLQDLDLTIRTNMHLVSKADASDLIASIEDVATRHVAINRSLRR